MNRDPWLATSRRPPSVVRFGVRIGMPLRSGRFVGTIWRIWRGHVFSINSDGPIVCDFRVHRLADVHVTKGSHAVAPPDLSKQRIAKTWQAADA